MSPVSGCAGRCFLRKATSPAETLGTVFLLCALLSGCASVTNPVAEGVPVRRLPPVLLGESRESLRLIPLNLLRQKPPEVYQSAKGDILGIYIEGVLGERNQAPPVRFPENGNLPPALGFPIPVRENGTISLPLIEPVEVRGLSITQAEDKVRDAYTVKKQIPSVPDATASSSP